MTVKPVVHEIRTQNQVIFLDTSIEYPGQAWVRRLHDWIGETKGHNHNMAGHLTRSPGVVCRPRRIQSLRYEIRLQMQSAAVSETTYTSLAIEKRSDSPCGSRLTPNLPRLRLARFTENTVQQPFALTESKVQWLKDSVTNRFQSLRDLEAEYVLDRFGDSLANWQRPHIDQESSIDVRHF